MDVFLPGNGRKDTCIVDRAQIVYMNPFVGDVYPFSYLNFLYQ